MVATIQNHAHLVSRYSLLLYNVYQYYKVREYCPDFVTTNFPQRKHYKLTSKQLTNVVRIKSVLYQLLNSPRNYCLGIVLNRGLLTLIIKKQLMRINIICDPSIAAKYHRSIKEYIDAEPNDTIQDIKLKVTLIFLELDTQDFDIYLMNGRKLNDSEKILDLQKQVALEFRLVMKVWHCCIIF